MRSLLSRIAAFTALVVAALLVAGPAVMGAVFGQDATYGRVGLAAVGLGMGLHMTAGALTQAALARGRVAAASAIWLGCGAGFLAALLAGTGAPGVERAELSYAAATAVLAAGLALVYRSGGRDGDVTPVSDRAMPPSARTPARSEPVAVGTHDA